MFLKNAYVISKNYFGENSDFTKQIENFKKNVSCCGNNTINNNNVNIFPF
jgi:hypothetical protein